MSDDRGSKKGKKPAKARKEAADPVTARESRDDRAFALSHRLAMLEVRERDLNEMIIGHREQIARLGAERDALQTRLAEHQARDLEVQRRERDAEAAIADRDERARGLEEQIAALKADLDAARAEAAEQRERARKLQSSRSYKLVRVLWRVSTALRRPFRRSRPRSPAAPGESGESAGRPRPVDARVGVRVGPERWGPKTSSEPMDTRDLRVAAVLDEMSRDCFAPDCNLLTIGSEDWQEELESHQPQLLLVESAWRGNGESWRYMVGSYPRADLRGLPKLRALVDWCRERDIPTAFWGKEDPIHFDRFREAAALFDCIFTTDGNCVPMYEELPREGDGPVTALQFAAQPAIHNPIPLDAERVDAPCFAGTYYRNRHVDRRDSLEMLLDAARPFGLEIYDRTFDWDNESFGFPERFLPHVKGSLPYSEVVEAYKTHKVFLNVNSVADSPTMFSRRVFELLACDAAVVSTESTGVERTFGDLVPIVTRPEEATETLTRLIGDDDYRRQLVVRARRLVLTEHTYRRRLALIGQTLGYAVSADAGDGVAAVALVDDAEQAREVRGLVAAITAQKSVPAEFLVGLGLETSVAGDLRELSDAATDVRVRVVQQDQGGERLQRFRELASLATSPWIGIVHPAHRYGEHHFMDLLSCTRFADADVIGNAAFELMSAPDSSEADLELRFVDSVHPHSALAKRELVVRRGWPDVMPGAGQTLREWSREGVRCFSGGAGNFTANPALGLPPSAEAAFSESAPAG